MGTVNYLKFVDMEGADELHLKFGEAVGLCYLVSVGVAPVWCCVVDKGENCLVCLLFVIFSMF